MRAIQCQDHYLRRDAKADGEDARANTGRNEQMMIIFDNVTGGVTLSELRGHLDTAEERQIHLTAVGMTRQRENYP